MYAVHILMTQQILSVTHEEKVDIVLSFQIADLWLSKPLLESATALPEATPLDLRITATGCSYTFLLLMTSYISQFGGIQLLYWNINFMKAETIFYLFYTALCW